MSLYTYILLTAVSVSAQGCPAVCPLLSGVCESAQERFELIQQGTTPDTQCCATFECHKQCASYCKDPSELTRICTAPNTIQKMAGDECNCNHCVNPQGEKIDLPYCQLNTIICLSLDKQAAQCPTGMVLELAIPKDPKGHQPCCHEYHCVKMNSCYQACGHKTIGADCHCDEGCAGRKDCCKDMEETCPYYVDELRVQGIWQDPPTPAPTSEPAPTPPPTIGIMGGGGNGNGNSGSGNGNGNGNGNGPSGSHNLVNQASGFAAPPAYSKYPLPDQCSFACGARATSGCWCDEHCFANKDCCFGFAESCPPWKMPPSGTPRAQEVVVPPAENMGPPDFSHLHTACNGLCGLKSTTFNGDACYCDDKCHANYDCCTDKEKFCGKNTHTPSSAQAAPQGAWGSNSLSAFAVAAAMATSPVTMPSWMFQANSYNQNTQHHFNKNPGGLTCMGHCGWWSVADYDSHIICFCDKKCASVGDCCADFAIACAF